MIDFSPPDIQESDVRAVADALGWDIKDFPNSYDYYQNLITLPLHTQLSDADVAYVCDALGTVVRGTRGAHAATVAHATQG
jgi:hypothetical protein